MGLADLLPVPPFDGVESSPPREPLITPALGNGGEALEKVKKVPKRKRTSESVAADSIKHEENLKSSKAPDKKEKKRRKPTIDGGADSLILAAGSNDLIKQETGTDDHLSKGGKYDALYAQLETKIKSVKSDGKRRGHEAAEKAGKNLLESGKAESRVKVSTASDDIKQGTLKAGGHDLVSSEAERRALKNAKRKQRREKALSFKGSAQKPAAAAKVIVESDEGILSALVSKMWKKLESSIRLSEEEDTAGKSDNASPHSVRAEAKDQTKKAKPASFLEKMQARLWGGKFRMLNETLYTCNGEDAFALFKEDPSAFEIYHAGYQDQMARWPKLPVVVIADWLRAHSAKLVVADFGCGSGKLADMVDNKVISLDLVASRPSVIACNMAHTPLDDLSVDVAVFCLSLMGTDYPSYLKEAHRVLKPSGWLLIAEVRSRFDPSNGGADPGEFSRALKSLGFSLELEDSSNKMFILLYFKKQAGKGPKKRKASWPALKPCVYKRR